MDVEQIKECLEVIKLRLVKFVEKRINSKPMDEKNIEQHISDVLCWSKTFDRMTWYEAVKFCEELEFEGHSDWRLPTLDELRALQDSGKNPHGDTKPGDYWSSTTFADFTGNAWLVNFSDGVIYSVGKTSTYYVRAVRERKESE
jgi:hypothetical protein